MRHFSSLVLLVLFPGLLLGACSGEKAAAPVEAARDAAGPASNPDGPAGTSPDRAVLNVDPDAARPDGPPPPPDARPDYAPSGLPGITAIVPPTIASPSATAPLADTPLEVTGSDFAADAVVFFGGQMLPTTRVSAEKLTVQITAALVPQPGAYAVQVENGGADARARSNLVYLTTAPSPTEPEVVGYNPDNGTAGDVVRIVGSNLAGAPLTITGPGGVTATPGTPERVAWNGPAAPPNRDAVPITLPAGWKTGPIVVKTAAAAYQGPIFWVGTNLTRLAGASGQGSSQYPSATYAATSANDNNLLTAWYTATGNCTSASCTMGPPSFTITLPSPLPLTRLAVRGLRDQYRGSWDYIRARFELFDAPDRPPLFIGSFLFPGPERDYDVFFTKAITARVVRLVAEQDLSTGPGLSEIELFAPDDAPLPPLTPDAGAPLSSDAGADASSPD